MVKITEPPKKIIIIIALIRLMLVYSAKNSRVKFIEVYSTLKPATSSDSPSVRSKGVRFVSANLEIMNIVNTGNKGINSHIFSCSSSILFRLNELIMAIVVSMIKPIAISYLIICAVARMAPMNAYLEFLDHPVSSTE